MMLVEGVGEVLDHFHVEERREDPIQMWPMYLIGGVELNKDDKQWIDSTCRETAGE